MIEFELNELATLAGGELTGGNLSVKRVSTDSRDCKEALFVALKGGRFDAHDFIESALKNGAAALGVSRDVKAQVPVLKVADTLRLLGLCGKAVRQKSSAKIISLTGSCGKTTVKELTCGIMSQCGKTVATAGNFNNDVGVPLTLMRLEKDTEFAVIEQGASHPQDISRTCEFVQADTALINNAGSAHIEGFGSLEGVYLGKSEILQDVLSRGGKGAVPADSPWTERWKRDFAGAFEEGRLVTFGTAEDAYVRVSDINAHSDGVSCKIAALDQSFEITLPLLGVHNAMNAAAACALSLISGAPFGALKPGLLSYKPVKGRLCAHDLQGLTLIDDAYNASFDSVIAAIDVLKGARGTRVLIFGDMGELGGEALELHRRVGDYARGKIDRLWCLGSLTAQSVEAFGNGARLFESREALTDEVAKLVASGYASFLVKGSHAMHMDLVNEAIRGLGEKK